MHYRILLVAFSAALAACTSYVLPRPAEFTPAQTLTVEGGTGFKLGRMSVGNYTVQIDRSSTRERQEGSGAIRERGTRQGYSFVIRLNDATVFTGGCHMESDALGVAAPGGVVISPRESSRVECEMLPRGTGRDSWKLELSGKPDNPLTGRLRGDTEYAVQGIGTAFGSTKYGPTGGYYIKQGERIVASVQVTGKRQILFAPDVQSEPLLAAAIALLLIDEAARSVD